MNASVIVPNGLESALRQGQSQSQTGLCLSMDYWMGSSFRYNHLLSHTVCLFQHIQYKMSQKN